MVQLSTTPRAPRAPVVTWSAPNGGRLHLCAIHSAQYEAGTLPQRYAAGSPICQVSHGLHHGEPCDVCYPDRDPVTGRVVAPETP